MCSIFIRIDKNCSVVAHSKQQSMAESNECELIEACHWSGTLSLIGRNNNCRTLRFIFVENNTKDKIQLGKLDSAISYRCYIHNCHLSYAVRLYPV